MVGITMEPREETSATAEPEIPPKNMESRQFTQARPPRNLPTMAFAKSTILSDIPPAPMISPARMKKGTAINEKLLMDFAICCTMVIRGRSR